MIQFPQDLIDAFNSDEVVCVVGSGPSIAAGYPSWSELLLLMIGECEKQLVGFKQGPELRKLLKQGHLLEVADECAKLLAGHLYQDFFQRTFRKESIRPTKLHNQLTQLPFSAILTTNYDNLLERAYILKNRATAFPFVFTQKNVAQLPRLASERRFFIFKMHGDADDVQTIVLTEQDYKEVIHNDELYQTALSQILATRTMLFLGFGLRDDHLNLILGKQSALFKAYGRRHYALLPDPGTILPKSFLEHYNISVIPYDSKGNHADLEKLLKSLHKQVKKVPDKSENDEVKKLHQLMQVEREFCSKLGTYIELERARFLNLHSQDIFDKKSRKLIEDSIKFWEVAESNRRNVESQLRQSQKMESIGQLAGGVAHDFNNILTVILMQLHLLHRDANLDKATTERLKEVEVETVRAANLTRQLLMFSRRSVMQVRAVNVNDVVQNLLKMLRRLLGEDISIILESQSNLPAIEADIGLIEQVLLNLAVNARDAMPKGGVVKIQTTTVSFGDEHLKHNSDARIGSFVRMSIIDTGCGIPAENQSRLFEPFFTTKEIGKGTGLGLATSYGIVKQHQGWIEFESVVGKGTSFHVYFPKFDDKYARTENAKIEKADGLAAIRGGTETILLVEDEFLVRRMVANILQGYGYNVLQASDGVQAVEIWKKHKQEIKLLLTDLVMPAMNGRELAEILCAADPSLKVIYTSGYSPEAAGKDFKLEPGFNFLPKPYNPQKLAMLVRTFLDEGCAGIKVL
jgi:signal transduction histidine kinase/ActR/RegA family two-component response regulator